MDQVPPGAPPAAAPAPVVKRKKHQGDPFFRGTRKPGAPGAPGPLAKPQPNGHLTPPTNGHPPSKPIPSRSSAPAATPRPAPPFLASVPAHERVSGFTDPRVTAEGIPFRDYKLVTTKRELLASLRHHVMHLAGDKPIDIRNESEFAKPARLHRRDPAALPPGGSMRDEKDEDELPKDGLTAGEREELKKRKEARQKEREANLAQIAPSQNPNKRVNNFKKKTQQVFRPDFSAEEKKRIQTNYEEKLPWHLEDFDNKHCLVGHHQMGSMGSHVAFVYEPIDASNAKFRLVPVEKVYQFKPKRDAFQAMTIDEAEAAMKKRGSDPEWLIRSRERRLQEVARERASKEAKGLFSAKSGAVAGRTGEEADLDFEDDFADDEEGDMFYDKDEDEKIAEKKIKEDHLTANIFDIKDLKEYDEADERERRETEARKQNFKGLRKALEKRERNYNHGSDSEGESTTDSEEERERAERERLAKLKKEEEAAAAAAAAGKDKPSSGGNTPSGRREKTPRGASDREDARGMKKSSSSKSLKRPGSPNLSDASGTDASVRKKKKSKHLTSSSQPTPQPSRPMSPANVPASSSAPQSLDPASAARQRKKARPGAGSDTETAASDRDGGAMSDGARRRILLKVPGASAGTDTPAGGESTTNPPSRAGSPAPAAPAPFLTEDDIRRLIGPEGTPTKEFLAKAPHARDADRRKEFMELVKRVARFDKETGRVYLRGSR